VIGVESAIIGLMDRNLEVFLGNDNLNRLVKDWGTWKDNGIINSVKDAVMGQAWAYLENQWALFHGNHVNSEQEKEFLSWMRKNSYMIRGKVELACER
jgi:hypothetical protein